jgi:hypothetical protein
LLVLPRNVYVRLIGDPFAVADRFPPPWDQRGDLPALFWPAQPLPQRTVEEVQKVLQRTTGPVLMNGSQAPVLLGSAQALVDGGKLVYERPGPDTDLLRGLWTLLPHSTRCQLWPASFAFGNTLGFDALVVRRAMGDEYTGYLNEEQAADYPEGRYELNLQIAAESGDQRSLNALFNRRSSSQTLRLAAVILVLFIVLALFMKIVLNRPSAPTPPTAPATTAKQVQPTAQEP